MTRPALLAAALAALWAAPSAADPLRIPLVRDSDGRVMRARVTVKLTGPKGGEIIAWDTATGTQVTDYMYLPLEEDDLTVNLTPTERIATDPQGTPTRYEVLIETARASQRYSIQMPTTTVPVSLKDLVGAAAIPAGSLLIDRLLPTAAGASPGNAVVLGSDLRPTWGTVSGGSSGGGSWGSISGSLADQVDLSAALAARPLAADLAGRLLPDVTGASPGHAVVLDADLHPTWGAVSGGSSGGGSWGSISGSLADQVDLSAALAARPLAADLASVATSGLYADLSGTPSLPTGGITESQVAHWEAAAAGARPVVVLGDIGENLTWTAHGATATGRLTADVDLDVALPDSGAWYSVLRLTADCDCEMSVVGPALVAVDMPPIRPGIGGTVLVLILALPDGAAISTVPLQ